MPTGFVIYYCDAVFDLSLISCFNFPVKDMIKTIVLRKKELNGLNLACLFVGLVLPKSETSRASVCGENLKETRMSHCDINRVILSI